MKKIFAGLVCFGIIICASEISYAKTVTKTGCVAQEGGTNSQPTFFVSKSPNEGYLIEPNFDSLFDECRCRYTEVTDHGAPALCEMTAEVDKLDYVTKVIKIKKLNK